jgi:hypothetical protein
MTPTGPIEIPLNAGATGVLRAHGLDHSVPPFVYVRSVCPGGSDTRTWNGGAV